MGRLPEGSHRRPGWSRSTVPDVTVVLAAVHILAQAGCDEMGVLTWIGCGRLEILDPSRTAKLSLSL